MDTFRQTYPPKFFVHLSLFPVHDTYTAHFILLHLVTRKPFFEDLRKREATGSLEMKHLITLCRELAWQETYIFNQFGEISRS